LLKGVASKDVTMEAKTLNNQKSTNAGAICMVLAAGFNSVEKDIAEDLSGSCSNLAGIPKALLPVAGKPMLDYWWETLLQNREVSEVFIICNALKYKHFERWATFKGIGIDHVINTGATSPATCRGALRDLLLGIDKAKHVLGSLEGKDLLVFAGDHLFFKDFDLGRILDFRGCKGGSLLLYYGRRNADQPAKRGMCEVDRNTSKVTGFAEKPGPGERGQQFPFVSPLFYILEPRCWMQLASFVAKLKTTPRDDGTDAHSFIRTNGFGNFIEYAISNLQCEFWGMRMPGAFFLVGETSRLEEYQLLEQTFRSHLCSEGGPSRRITKKTYARVGLVGNPSDGFGGKTIAATIDNFWATAEIWESDEIRLLPHPLYDPSAFSSLADLQFIGRREGYYGGTRLLMATCKRFQEICTQHGIALPRKNFTLKYDTNIPRQVGLSGSSAICNSVFQALMHFYGLTEEHMPLERQPSFILSVEQELGIQAGLQDRVVQVYQGVVFMDFDSSYMQEHGHGTYERLPRSDFDWLASLPLFLAYESDPSDSGKIHSNVKRRWEAKEPEVVEGMTQLGNLAARGRQAIAKRDQANLADIMDQNFKVRRQLYGDAALGANNIEMIEICQGCGAAAKFPGSGGAVLGLCRSVASKKATTQEEATTEEPQNPSKNDESHEPCMEEELDGVRQQLEAAGYVFCRLNIVMPES